jgi:hypothetical protein
MKHNAGSPGVYLGSYNPRRDACPAVYVGMLLFSCTHSRVDAYAQTCTDVTAEARA